MRVWLPIPVLSEIRQYCVLLAIALLFTTAFVLDSRVWDSRRITEGQVDQGERRVRLRAALADASRNAAQRGVGELDVRLAVLDSISTGGFRLTGPAEVDMTRVNNLLDR